MQSVTVIGAAGQSAGSVPSHSFQRATQNSKILCSLMQNIKTVPRSSELQNDPTKTRNNTVNITLKVYDSFFFKIFFAKSITLANDQLDAQIFNIVIRVLYS